MTKYRQAKLHNILNHQVGKPIFLHRTKHEKRSEEAIELSLTHSFPLAPHQQPLIHKVHGKEAALSFFAKTRNIKDEPAYLWDVPKKIFFFHEALYKK